MKATRYAEGLNKKLVLVIISLALLLALVLPSDGTGVVQASPGTETLRPDGLGDETGLRIDGTPAAATNWESVDEETPDEDSTYVYHDGTDYLRDLYNIVDHSLGSGKINSVTVHARCNSRKTPEQASLKIVLKSGTTTEESVEKTLTKDYSNYSNTWTTNPDTGSAFTWGEVDSLQVGVSLREDKAGTGDYSRCTQVWVDVDYTPFSTAISIVGKVGDTAITTITFPEGAPDATVSDPYNNVDTEADPQVLHASASDPVVRLKNTSGGTLTVWLEITTWANGVAASEDYELVDTTTTVAAVDDVLSADGGAASVDTAVSMATGTYKALYLELVLSSLAGKSGSSTITILGEAA